ncbi:MAG TPA: TorF family putative porin [Burkholderiales bacterium]|nr:TorF family putative porin [Burkholderiales bacterium]
MRKSILALSVAAALAAPALASADQPASPVTANVTLASQYIYRGIAQSRGKPAIQGGFDYTNPNGIYVGTWASSISWISDAATSSAISAPIEIDVYGGYRGSITKDLGYDVGILTYNYPGTNISTGAANPDTVELHGALSYAWLTAKYSLTTGTSLFGWVKPDGGKTTGSGYFELNGAWDMGNGLGLSAHVGHQSVNGLSDASYTDYNVGVTKAFSVGTLGLLYSDTNAKSCGDATPMYCNTLSGTANTYDLGKGALVLSFSKTF